MEALPGEGAPGNLPEKMPAALAAPSLPPGARSPPSRIKGPLREAARGVGGRGVAVPCPLQEIAPGTEGLGSLGFPSG